MSHRDPKSRAWLLAERSKALWQELFQLGGTLTESSVEWQRSGSMLLATCAAETEQLCKRQVMLEAAGITAAVMDAEALRAEEPALGSAVCAGLLTRTDAQLVRSVSFSSPLSVHFCESLIISPSLSIKGK